MQIKRIIVIGLGVFYMTRVWAPTATANFQPNITVSAVCSVSAANLTFSTVYNPFSASSNDGTTTLTVKCTLAAPYTVALTAGNTGTFAARKLVNASYSLNYNLYTASDHTTIWGDGTSGTSTVPGAGTGLAQPLTVFGSIPTGQATSPAGTYTDMITVTVNF